MIQASERCFHHQGPVRNLSLLRYFYFSDSAEFPLNFLLFSLRLHRSRVSFVSADLPPSACRAVKVSPLRPNIKHSLHITGCRLHQPSNLFHKWIFSSCLELQPAGRAELLLPDGFLGVAAAPHSLVPSSRRGMWGMQQTCDNTDSLSPHRLNHQTHCRIKTVLHTVRLLSESEQHKLSNYGSGPTQGSQDFYFTFLILDFCSICFSFLLLHLLWP